MKLAQLIIALSAFMALEAKMMAEQADIRLIDHISARAPSINLGQIAIIEADDEDLKEKLVSLEIDHLPQVGASRTISSYKVRKAVEDAGIHNFSIHGYQSTVKTETKKISEEELKEAIAQYIKERTEGKDIDIQYVRLPTDWDFPNGKGTSIQVDEGRSDLKSRTNVKLRAIVNGQILSQTNATVDIRIYDKAAVLVRPISRGEVLTKEHFEVKKSDVTEEMGMYLTIADDLIGLISKKDFGIGKMVLKKDFQEPIAISQGSFNRIVIVNGNIKMSIAGAKALQNGRKGDFILFAHPINESETLQAKVVRPGLAYIKVR